MLRSFHSSQARNFRRWPFLRKLIEIRREWIKKQLNSGGREHVSPGFYTVSVTSHFRNTEEQRFCNFISAIFIIMIVNMKTQRVCLFQTKIHAFQ